MKTKNIPVAQPAHSIQNIVTPTGSVPPSKLAEVRAVILRPEVQGLEKEFRLFVNLLLGDGAITGTIEQIGKSMLTEGRNVKNWLNKLDGAGIVTVTKSEHRQMEIRLKEPYLQVASRVDSRPEPTNAENPDDPDVAKLLTIYKTAKETGQVVEITTVKRIDCAKSA